MFANLVLRRAKLQKLIMNRIKKKTFCEKVFSTAFTKSYRLVFKHCMLLRRDFCSVCLEHRNTSSCLCNKTFNALSDLSMTKHLQLRTLSNLSITRAFFIKPDS